MDVDVDMGRWTGTGTGTHGRGRGHGQDRHNILYIAAVMCSESSNIGLVG
jgi:hypothetical protein